MSEVDPFSYSKKDQEITDRLRASGDIPQDWRYAELSWIDVVYFNKIVEIGGDAIRIIELQEFNGKKCCSFTLGPAAAKRLNDKYDELYSLLNTLPSGWRGAAETGHLAA